ncbi:MAG: hypothetical protein LBM73_00920 [Candidatus Nomurabacteria bacterium]|nr:hypothetical protein [Candidatus Nomurabacteria bacterium]
MLDIVNSRERERSIAFRQEMLETPMPRHQRRAKKIGEGSEAEVYKIKDCVIKTYATGKESFNYIREAELDRRIMAAAAMRGVECFEQMCAASFSALNAAFNFVPGQTLDDDEMNYNTLGTPTIPIYNLDSQITSFAFEDPRSENFILKPDGTIVRIDYKVPFEQERRFTELIESGGLLARAVNSVALV